MAFIPALIAGLGGLGGLFGSKTQQQQTSTQNQQSGSTSNTSGLNVNTPQLNPVASSGYEQLSSLFQNLLGKDPDLSGYQAQQTGNINNLANQQQQNEQEILAAKGITGPAAATGAANVESQRVGSITNLQQQIPLLANQLQQQTAGNFLNVIKGMPVGNVTQTTGIQGQNSFSSQQGTGTQNNSQNPLAGLFGGLGNLLASLYGSGAFNSQNGSPGGVPNGSN